ncbi:hypothetical protein SLS61_004903 [Didymella pomorum]
MASSPYENWVSNPAEDNAKSTKFALLAQAVVNQLAINLGFGKHVLDINFDNSTRIAYYGASGLSVSMFATTLSKVSFAVTLVRLTDGWPRRWAFFAMTTLATFAIPTMVLPFMQCKPIAKTFVDLLPGTCIDKQPSLRYARFQAIWAAAMDISLALLPWKVLWGLQMRKTEKIGVCVAMSLGILAGIASILRGRYVDLLAEQDLSFTKAVNSAIFTYQNSSSRSRNQSRMEKSTAKSTGAEISLRQSSKNLDNRVGQDSKGYLELDEMDLVVDERTGRITAATPDSVADVVERKKADWPLER